MRYDTIPLLADQLMRPWSGRPMKRRLLIIAVLAILLSASPLVEVSNQQPVSAQTPTTTVCTPLPPPPCNDGAAPGVIQIIPDGSSPANKAKLARKRFYLSSCPFNLVSSVRVTTAPTLRTFYSAAGASSQLISWLEDNHCETIYCRALTIGEANCEGLDPNKCVPEFATAYRNALSDLKGDANLALKMITNYQPLANPKLRIGFYEARTEWLKNAVGKIESAVANNYRIKTTITDKEGIGFFYELCPGSYYVSSVAPIDVSGVEIIWETVKPVKVEGPPEMKTATRVTLAFPPSKDKKNYFVGKPVGDIGGPKAVNQ
jgi:hypothetical protein